MGAPSGGCPVCWEVRLLGVPTEGPSGRVAASWDLPTPIRLSDCPMCVPALRALKTSGTGTAEDLDRTSVVVWWYGISIQPIRPRSNGWTQGRVGTNPGDGEGESSGREVDPTDGKESEVWLFSYGTVLTKGFGFNQTTRAMWIPRGGFENTPRLGWGKTSRTMRRVSNMP